MTDRPRSSTSRTPSTGTSRPSATVGVRQSRGSATSRSARRTADALSAQLDEALHHLDLRTWVVDTLRWHDWALGREFDIIRCEGARLVEAGPGERLQIIDSGSVRVTSRRITFIGYSQVRSATYPQVVGWSRGETSLSLASNGDGTVWHVIDVPDSTALMAAVFLNLADSMLDDHLRTLDRIGNDLAEDYTEAFIAAEVAPAQSVVAALAARLEAVEAGREPG